MENFPVSPYHGRIVPVQLAERGRHTVFPGGERVLRQLYRHQLYVQLQQLQLVAASCRLWLRWLQRAHGRLAGRPGGSQLGRLMEGKGAAGTEMCGGGGGG